MRHSHAVLPQPGEKVGRYTVLERLGSGGMGVVFSAYDDRLARVVALKVLHAEAGHTATLLNEARALAKLAHPNVVAVHDAQELFGEIAIAMEYVPGATLRGWLLDKPRTRDEILAVLIEAGRGLAAAHAAGVIHRDFKPDNVLVGADGRVRVTDFGLAHVGQTAGVGRAEGTPGYTAPEQAAGQAADARADQFSFCVTLAEALTGKNPVKVVATPDVVPAAAAEVAAIPSGPIRAVVARGLARDPAERFPSMDALLAALVPPKTTRWPLGVAAAVALAVISAVAWWNAQKAQECSGAEQRLVGIWDAATREALKAHFTASKASFGASAWDATDRGLDAWAKRWADAHRDACEATRKRKEQPEDVLDLRVACFERLRTEAHALVQVLKAGDAAVIAKSPRAVADLRGADVCADVVALKTTVPIAPEKQADRAKLLTRIADLTARRTAGKFAGLVEETAQMVKDARALGWPPLIADALVEQSFALEDDGKSPEAWKALEDAVLAAEAGRSYATLIRAYAYLVLMTIDLDKPGEAELLYRHAQAVLAQAPSAEREAQLEAYYGSALRKQGRYTEAAEHGQKAAALARALVPPRPITVAVAVNMLALTMSAQNKDDAAAALTQEAIDRFEGVLGPEHPDVGLMRMNLGLPKYARGDFAGGLQDVEAGLAVMEKAYGGDHLRIAIALGARGKMLVELGRVDEAIASQTKALEMRKRLVGEKATDTGRMHAYRGEAAMVGQKYAEALADYQAAFDIFDKSLSKTHAFRIEALIGLARAHFLLGARKEAVAAAAEARKHMVAADMDTSQVFLLDLTDAQLEGSVPKAEKAWAEIQKDPTMRSATPEIEAWLTAARAKPKR